MIMDRIAELKRRQAAGELTEEELAELQRLEDGADRAGRGGSGGGDGPKIPVRLRVRPLLTARTHFARPQSPRFRLMTPPAASEWLGVATPPHSRAGAAKVEMTSFAASRPRPQSASAGSGGPPSPFPPLVRPATATREALVRRTYGARVVHHQAWRSPRGPSVPAAMHPAAVRGSRSPHFLLVK